MILKKLSITLASSVLTFLFATTVSACDWQKPGCEVPGPEPCGEISIKETCIIQVSQSNNTIANTYISASSDTGDNTISKNTGGLSYMSTGDATTHVGVKVVGGDNYAEVPSCCECSDCTPCDIIGSCDGKGDIKFTSYDVTKVTQKSTTIANTKVKATSDTGGNTISKNTKGFSKLLTGDAFTSVKVKVFGGSNLMY
jgi:hypothetical protein